MKQPKIAITPKIHWALDTHRERHEGLKAGVDGLVLRPISESNKLFYW